MKVNDRVGNNIRHQGKGKKKKEKKRKKKGKGHEETQKREAQNSKEALKKQIQKDERCFVFMGLVKLN